jgi:hypothetical protein
MPYVMIFMNVCIVITIVMVYDHFLLREFGLCENITVAMVMLLKEASHYFIWCFVERKH